MPDDSLLVFVHIPRTGGSSIWKWLIDALPPVYVRAAKRSFPQVMIAAKGHRIKEPDAPLGWGLYGAETKHYIEGLLDNEMVRVAGGHLAYGLHERIQRPCQYLTVLRDPVERVISLYSMVKARPRTFYEDAQIGDPLAHCWYDEWMFNLLEMCEPDGAQVLQNDQTRMITGGEVDVDKAIALLQERYLFTTIDGLPALRQPLIDFLDLDTVNPFPHTNQLERVTGFRKKPVERYIPTNAELQAIIKANHADIALYEWATQHLTEAHVPIANAATL